MDELKIFKFKFEQRRKQLITSDVEISAKTKEEAIGKLLIMMANSENRENLEKDIIWDTVMSEDLYDTETNNHLASLR